MPGLKDVKERIAKKAAEYELIASLATDAKKEAVYRARAAKFRAAFQKLSSKIRKSGLQK